MIDEDIDILGKDDKVPVVQTLDGANHHINLFPKNKYQGNKLLYPLDSIIHLSDNWAQIFILT